MWCTLSYDAQLVVTRQRRECMRYIGAPHAVCAAWSCDGSLHSLKVSLPGRSATFSDALGDFNQGLFHKQPPKNFVWILIMQLGRGRGQIAIAPQKYPKLSRKFLNFRH